MLASFGRGILLWHNLSFTRMRYQVMENRGPTKGEHYESVGEGWLRVHLFELVQFVHRTGLDLSGRNTLG